jgi:hypothetical protein
VNLCHWGQDEAPIPPAQISAQINLKPDILKQACCRLSLIMANFNAGAARSGQEARDLRRQTAIFDKPIFTSKKCRMRFIPEYVIH